MFYRLEDKKPVPCATGRQWVDWFESAGEALIVGQDEVGLVFVLTVFTGIAQDGSDPPRLFETMTSVNGQSTGISLRSSTWDEAERQHRRMSREAREGDDYADA